MEDQIIEETPVEIDEEGNLYIEETPEPPEPEEPDEVPAAPEVTRPTPPIQTDPGDEQFDAYDFSVNPQKYLAAMEERSARRGFEAAVQALSPLVAGSSATQIANDLAEEYSLPAAAKALIREKVSQLNPLVIGQLQTNTQARKQLAQLAYGELAMAGKITELRKPKGPQAEPTAPLRKTIPYAPGIDASDVQKIEKMVGHKMTVKELKEYGLVA